MTVCCHVTVCLCTNGGHHESRHIASVTRCKTAKAVMKPFTPLLIRYCQSMPLAGRDGSSCGKDGGAFNCIHPVTLLHATIAALANEDIVEFLRMNKNTCIAMQTDILVCIYRRKGVYPLAAFRHFCPLVEIHLSADAAACNSTRSWNE